MKFNIKTKMDIKKFIPNKIIPRSGPLKRLNILEKENNILLSSLKCKVVELPKKVRLDHKDFTAIGLYLAEGTTYYNLKNRTKHDGQVAFVNSNAHCIKLVCRLLNKFRIDTKSLSWNVGLNINYKNKVNKERLFNYWVNKLKLDKNKSRPKWIYYSGRIGGRLSNNTGKKGCLHIFYYSTILRNFFVSFVQKVFEDSIKENSKEKLALILRGFFAGDGSVNYSAKYNRKQVEFLSNDLDLLNKIRESLKILGLNSIRETWPESTKTHTKSLRIYNVHDFRILAEYDIPNLINYKKDTFSKIIKTL